ncbi:MAG: hypothetical protein A2X84_01995 [Desulfuromonadaceae bacterium GWC2_58_13]|nr:MAG: hypothetical protein A2X84_01995 [Desulfuromonadaceae bacterium GWC2_58_13]
MKRQNNLLHIENRAGLFRSAPLLFALAILTCGDPAANAATARAAGIQEGDLAQVHVTAISETGTVLFSSRREVVEGDVWVKDPNFSAPRPLIPEEVVAGRESRIPGLGKAVLGLIPGETRKLTLAPEEAFGTPDPNLRRDFPCERTVPRSLRMPADRYLQLAGSFPKEGQDVHLIPYLQCRVVKVEDAAVVLEFSAEDGRRIEEDFGTVSIRVSEADIRTRLQPRLGASFTVENQTGRILSSDGDRFTVDFNPPRMGQSLTLDIEVLSHLPAATFSDAEIEWASEFDKGMARARQEGKPVVLVLYADWCSWCKRFFHESIEDVRVKNTYDRFVWMKINSDVEKQFKEKFGQKGFPMIVLMSPEGEVLNKTEGFMDGGAFSRDLKVFFEHL